jgi:hypothetical protein
MMRSRPDTLDPGYQREKVDQVTVGVAEEHRPAAPGLIGRLQNKFINEYRQSGTLSIDVLHLKIENYGAIGAWLCGSSIEKIHAALAGDG